MKNVNAMAAIMAMGLIGGGIARRDRGEDVLILGGDEYEIEREVARRTAPAATVERGPTAADIERRRRAAERRAAKVARQARGFA